MSANQAPRRCGRCNGSGQGDLVVNGSGSQTRERCGPCHGTGQV